ncbi:MAG TPA: transcriptional regulator, partial [Anaerolineae bacterium]
MTTASSRPAARRRLLLAGIVILAALLRVWAAWQLPVDFDEPVYLRAGFDYAALMRTGQLAAVVDDPLNGEHPPLVKLSYAVGILSLGKEAGWSQALFVSRGISAAFGVLAVFLLALVDPLAGGLLAVQTLVIKYTSQAYLEALPLAAGLAALLALRRAAAARAWAGWPWLSAVCLGLAAAGKLIYPLLFLPPLLAIAAGERHRPRRKAAAYAGLALLTFWLFDPALWHDPLGRLAGQLQFYGRYATGAAVQMSGYPWYQPLLWLSSNWPARWHPQVFLYYGLDAVIFWAAAAGLWHEWRDRRWLVIWLATGVAVLLVWPTKWPQYTVALAPAFCLAAAASLRRARAWSAEQADYWPWVRELVPRPSPFFLIAPLAIVLALAAFYAGNKIQA